MFFMEEGIELVTSATTTGWSFSTFLRYFAPGWFTAFWLVLYAIRMVHPVTSGDPITSEAELLTFLHTNWQGIVGIIIALGGFLGVLLVGIDPIIRAFMGSRLLNFILKYLLSSKKVDFVYTCL